ncbi:MAG TPA: hypothetical protein VFX16_07215 [Pseudonocardiaceae bacterium]|nr:hypothetical protein [Pseudonocardiaceae bacterium]
MSENWQLLFEAELDVDDDGGMRGSTIVADEEVLVRGRPNRIALALGDPIALGPTPESDAVGWDIPLRCVIHPEADCHFQSAKLVVDLRATPGAIVRDMAPREVRGEHPVEITTTIGANLSFQIGTVATGELKRDRETKETTHYPVVLTSGRGFDRAVWDFRSTKDADLHPDRELRLLATVPPGAALVARFNFRSQVAVAGGRVLPMLRRKNEVDRTYQLVGVPR